MTALLKFELGTFFKRPGVYVPFFLSLLLGFFVGLKLSFSPGNEIYRNSPYAIANMVGLLSLCNIFTTTFFAAKMMLREHDSNFSLILYATPVKKIDYLMSRFLALFILAFLCFCLLIFGYLSAHLADSDKSTFGPLMLWHYFQPFFLLGIPNLLLCAVMVTTVAWIYKSKMMVYLTGLFIYLIYLVLLTYSGSPMMASGLPQSEEALRISALVDPFGLSAFYEQTNLWTVVEKNTQTLQLSGNFVLNRLAYITGSLLILSFMCYKFKFRLKATSRRNSVKEITAGQTIDRTYRAIKAKPSGMHYVLQVLKSLVRLDIYVLTKSTPFLLISLSLIFYLSMEFYGSIDQGIRLPQQYASSALMANRILHNLPGLLMIMMIFYVHELYWRSKDSGFDLIECSTPAAPIVFAVSKWISVSLVLILLTTIVSCTGIVFQFLYGYPIIDWGIYFTLYWLICAPLAIGVGTILLLQKVIHQKWVGLLLSCVFVVLLCTSLGKSLGITNPLLRFSTPYSARYSEMNGWDDYLPAFSYRMVFATALISFLWMLAADDIRRWPWHKIFAMIMVVALMVFSGTDIFRRWESKPSALELLDRSAAYERGYRSLQGMVQPVVSSVRTFIDLYPNENAYRVSGRYKVINKGKRPISELLVNFDDAVKADQVIYQDGNKKEFLKAQTGLHHLKNALLPGDSAVFSFSFAYRWGGLTGHEPFNAIVKNGSFLRISNYFPRFGYQSDEEIANASERRKRNLGDLSPLKKLNATRDINHFIDLDMTVSVPQGQRVIGVGELSGEWKAEGRHYFRYISGTPIPFRFGLSAAIYQVRKLELKNINIEIYYHKSHQENVDNLIRNAVRTLHYCEQNFGPYRYKTLRFAEVSSFTDGFAGTAYPATIFMTEQLIFHNNLLADRNQDVINELAAHEVSHQWWGNAILAPDEREGSKVLTETLAMYTELMLAERYLGADAVHSKVSMHEQIYHNERGFSREVPLYLSRPEDTYLYYSKGLVAMWKLKQLIGEKRINKALRSLLKKHVYPARPPISSDLLFELHQVTHSSYHQKIDSLFGR